MPLKPLGWLLVPLAGVAELGGHFYFSSRPPKLEDWRAVRPVVAELRKNRELVVVAPAWAEPNARAAFGDGLMPLADVARADVSAYARAVEVSILGAAAPDLRDFRVVRERHSGKFRLRVLENPSPAHVLYDFADRIAEASVADVTGPTETPCPWNPAARRQAGGLHGDQAYPAERHDCSGGGLAHFVGVTVIEDPAWRGRRCIWAEPTQGAALAVRFHDVPLGKVVRGYASIPFWTEREKRGSPVEMEVLAAGAAVGKYVHQDGDGWKSFEFATPGKESSRGDVEFRVRSPRASQQKFCFQADTR